MARLGPRIARPKPQSCSGYGVRKAALRRDFASPGLVSRMSEL
jgi:hypothetical protein